MDETLVQQHIVAVWSWITGLLGPWLIMFDDEILYDRTIVGQGTERVRGQGGQPLLSVWSEKS